MRLAWLAVCSLLVGCSAPPEETHGYRRTGVSDETGSGQGDHDDPSDDPGNADSSNDGGDAAETSGDSDTPDEPCEPVTGQYCQLACDTPSDCSSLTTGAYTADHYACDNGACRYLGCNNDDECECDFYPRGCTCREYACTGAKFCAAACLAAADCVTAGATGAYDADNYRCDDGTCVYTGCHSSAECMTSFSATGNTYVCKNDLCVQACTAAADCALTSGGAYDEDNYDCTSGGCVYTGCNSDSECLESSNGTMLCGE